MSSQGSESSSTYTPSKFPSSPPSLLTITHTEFNDLITEIHPGALATAPILVSS